ncbi:MAG: KpsF/GutQ family sugar-phosphate isomerase [Oceanospirillaceae bacterium]|nr:KpsF/GutQ family sugar-phosphate isomerase [Oceanospirillaceae bacterium]
MCNNNLFLTSARNTIALEAQAVDNLASLVDDNFAQACAAILSGKGRVIVMGMGKSGHIGNKIAATLASTGTPAFFVHPAEASHGDMGMITRDDIVLALSNSGESLEIKTILPLIKRMGIVLISITSKPNSTLATLANFHLNTGVDQEACPLNLAPTSSTTAQLVMGDALALAVLEAKGFNAEDFAFSHPGGKLGRKLLLKVADVMHCDAAIPIVPSGTLLTQALIEITQKRLGMTTIVDDQGRLLGIFTDGDLRRALDGDIDFKSATIDSVMTTSATLIEANSLAAEAVLLMQTKGISQLVITDSEQRPIGALNMQDLLIAGVL